MGILVGLFLVGGFTFQTPPGWVDLSPDAPEAERNKAPAALLEQVKSSGHAFFAADLAHADDGFMENVNAIVQPGSSPVTAALLDDVELRMRAEIGKQGMSYRVLEKSLVTVAGATAGRVVGELTMQGRVVKQIQYLLPGREHHAILTFSTTPESFAEYQPRFDAAGQATRGTVEPKSRWAKIGARAVRGAIIGGLLGGLAALVMALRKRMK